MRERNAFFIITLALVLFVACANNTSPTISIVTITPPRTLPTSTKNSATSTRAPLSPTRVPSTVTTAPPIATATRVPQTVTPTAASVVELTSETRTGWEAFVKNIKAIGDVGQEQTRIDQFWQEVSSKQRVPLLLQDAAVFLYKGAAVSVKWQGDFSYWAYGQGLEGKQVGETDLWYAVTNFPLDSRTDYEIVVNGAQGILDPANPHIRGGGLGDNSILAMPAFQVTDFTQHRADVAEGILTDWIPLDSKAWGAPINYRVYTPADYAALENLPVVYVTDGNDFSDERMGSMQIVIDNLIAGNKIAPVMAVFIDARNATNPDKNQRELQFLARPEDFARFIVDELVPTIDAQYHTDPSAKARTLVGVSFGGAFTTFAGLRYPDVFGNLTIFSPAYWVFSSPNSLGASLGAGAGRMNTFVQSKLSNPAFKTNQKIFLSGGIPAWDVGNLEPMAKRLRGPGNAVQVFHSQEGHGWGAWSGLTDEMLEYFFAN